MSKPKNRSDIMCRVMNGVWVKISKCASVTERTSEAENEIRDISDITNWIWALMAVRSKNTEISTADQKH